jgi:Zn-dependent M28 family amino/carboxypeptidase
MILFSCSSNINYQISYAQNLTSSINQQVPLFQHLRMLSTNDFYGRKIGSEGSIKAQNYIISVLEYEKIAPLDVKYRHAFSKKNLFGAVQGNNIVALIYGDKFVEQYIVLSAHYDHLGTMAGKVFNGADDNASGTAALLAIASKLAKKPLDYSVILLFTDGEESNLLGAKAFIKDHQGLVDNIKLNINLDMIAGDSKTNTLRYIDHGLQRLLGDDELKLINQSIKTKAFRFTHGFKKDRNSLTRRRNWKMASDHGVFYQEKIPFIYYGVDTHKNYHTENDDYENVNLPLYLMATNYIYQQLRLIDQVIY